MSHFHGRSAPINLYGIWEEINNQVRQGFGSVFFDRGSGAADGGVIIHNPQTNAWWDQAYENSKLG